MKRSSLFFIFILCSVLGYAQDLSSSLNNPSFFKSDYPLGLYKTKEDFLNKKPTDTFTVISKAINKEELKELEQNCFFYNKSTDKKITNYFAICYKGYLFFQINGILKNRNKTDRAQTNNFPNSYVAVLYGGNNYLYTEANLVNAWAQGAIAGAGGAFGMVGATAGAVASQGMFYGKGIVWDFKNKEFNIFKSCKDYNEFIKDKYPQGEQDCKNHQPDMLKVRNDIQNIL